MLAYVSFMLGLCLLGSFNTDNAPTWEIMQNVHKSTNPLFDFNTLDVAVDTVSKNQDTVKSFVQNIL